MRNNRRGKSLMILGLLLTAAALLLAVYNIWDERQAAASSGEALAQVEAIIPEGVTWGEEDMLENPAEREIPDYVLNPDMEMPVKKIDGYEYIGVLEIPSLDRSLPIMSEWDDQKLKIAPCRYTGSAYKGNLIIAGHNYRSHFSPLKNFTGGETIIFTDMDGNRFTYEVAEVEVLKGSDVERMQEGEWDLTLFTCTYGGQNRFTLRCELVDSYAEPGGVSTSDV